MVDSDSEDVDEEGRFLGTQSLSTECSSCHQDKSDESDDDWSSSWSIHQKLIFTYAGAKGEAADWM